MFVEINNCVARIVCKSNMKVIYFHQHFSTPEGSTGTRSFEMAQKLIQRGHRVLMVCGSYQGGNSGLEICFRDGARRGFVNDIEVLEFELPYTNEDSFIRRTWLFLKFAFRSVGVVLTEQYDLVFATSTPLTAGIPGILARWLRRKPFVFEVRDLWPELPKAMGVITNPVLLALMSILEWASYRSADRCIGLSPGIVDGIKRRGVSDDHVCMISNGCDLDIFSNGDSKRPEGVEKSNLLAIFTGAHGIANGVEAAIDAAMELKKRGREDIVLFFVGSGRSKQILLERVSTENLDNCMFMEPVTKYELGQYLQGSDIGMQLLKNVPAFYYGTSPNKFFDYIASGLPVLNNYPGWLSEMVDEHKCGYTVPPDDPSSFADALEHAADHREDLCQMGKNGYNLATQQFDRNDLSDQFSKWLEGAVT